MKDWIKRFFAVDNSVNEQAVIGALWCAVTLALIICRLVTLPVDMDLIWTTMSGSLLAFGVGGFKKP